MYALSPLIRLNHVAQLSYCDSTKENCDEQGAPEVAPLPSSAPAVDPASGLPVDPQTGRVIDPLRAERVRKQREQHTQSQASMPQQPPAPSPPPPPPPPPQHGGGEPSAKEFTECEPCVANGFGWSKKKRKCGGVSNWSQPAWLVFLSV